MGAAGTNDSRQSEKQETVPHILLLEDDRAFQDLAIHAFRESPDRFRVSVASSLRAAREMISSDPPDLILADWILPDGKGIEILPRDKDGRVTLPLVIMTGFGDERLAVEIMKSGAIEYIVKSGSVFDQIPSIVKRTLREWDNIQKRLLAEASARDSEKRLADIISFLPDAVLAIDTAGRVIAWNHAIEEMTGIPADRMLGKSDYEYSIPFYGTRRPLLINLVLEDNPELEKHYLYVKRSGDKILGEAYNPNTFGGRGAYLWGTASPLYDSTGVRVGAIEVVRDISTRKRNEEQLARSENTLKTLLNAPHDTIALLDHQGRIIDINTEGAKKFGKTVQEITGRCSYDLLPPDLARIRKEYLEQVFSTGRPVVFEDEREGIYFRNEAYPIFSKDKTAVEQVAIFARDITQEKEAAATLARNEDRFRRISSLTTDFAYSCLREPKGTFSLDWMSGALVAITGFTEEELQTSGCWRCLVVNEDLSLFDEKITGLIPGQSSRCELRIRAKDGSIKWLLCFAECTQDPARPDYARLYGGCRDITVRRNTELALRESETRFRDLFNNMSAGVVIYEPVRGGEDFIIRDMNRASVLIDQVKKEEVIGKSVLTVFPGIRDFGLFSVFQRVAMTGTPESHPVSFYHDDRITGWRENHIHKLPSGEIVAIYEDVTEKKQAEDDLHEAQEWLGMALMAAKAGTWDWDIPLEKLTWSREFFELFGLSKDASASFETWLATVHPEDRERAMAAITNSIRDHTYLWNEYRIRLPNGSVRWVGAGGSPSYDRSGKPLRMSGLCIDITDRKDAEQKLAASEEKYRQIVENSHEAIFIIENGIIRFANSVCEDIVRLPLHSILGRQFTDFAVMEEREQLLEGHHTFVKNPGGKRRQVFRVQRGDGTLGWLDVSTVRIAWQDHPATLNFATDITEQKRAQDALADSERKFRTVADYTYDWEYWILPDGTYRYISPSCERITGYSPDDFYRNPDLLMSLVHPEDMRIFLDHISSSDPAADSEVSAKNQKPFEFRIRAKSGEVVWIGHICQPLFDENGSFLGRRGSNRDITQRKLAESALVESETRFRALVQNSSDIIRILSADGIITYESPSSERILGYPAGSLIGKNPMEYIHPDDLVRVQNDLREVFEKTNNGLPTEFRIRKADGQYLWVDTLATNLLGIPGVNGIVVTTRPIDQRKLLELKIAESEERLRLALEGAEIASWDWNLATGKAIFSDRYFTMLGYEPGEFPVDYEHWIALIHPDEKDSVLSNLFEQIQNLSPLCEIEYRLKGKDGMYYWILGRGKIVETDPAGKAVRLIGVNIDITSRKMMESEIRSLNTVLEQRVRDRTEDLHRTNQALQEEIVQRQDVERKLKDSLEEKTVLLKEVHHRVKNNLQIIASLLNLQSRYIHDQATLSAIRESQNRVRAMALVHEKLYRSEELAWIDLSDYMQFLGNELFHFYDARGKGIRFSPSIRDISVSINEAIPLGLIINELISNSLKYAFPEGRTGQISIAVTQQDHVLTIDYLDDGIGISPALDWRNTQSLGLRLVNSLVDQLDGTIELDRSAGTRFVIQIHEKE